MVRLEQALSLIHTQLENEFGQDFKLEEGDGVACVLNDATVILGVENNILKCQVVFGEPLKIDYSIGSEE